ncbi:hypothetical protein H0H87_000204 [Tephrocybe sp. NHM501043]|nr:hypothetical protein H0H87_000204 [Tephrocybe sp. NHM501043]
MSNVSTVQIPARYSGIISGLARSPRKQRAVIRIYDSTGLEIFRSILIGDGQNVPLKEQIDPSSTGLAFGPFDYDASVMISIENEKDGHFWPSHGLAPITVNKAPTAKHPTAIRVTTVSILAAMSG